MSESALANRTAEGAEFARSGYVTLPGFLDHTELEALAVRIERQLATPDAGPACERPHNILVPLRWGDAPVECVLRSHGRVRRLADATNATDLRWISGYISLKEPHSPPLWWHQDWWCWDHSVTYRAPAPQVALLCYMGDTNKRNGALRVLPSSHRASDPLHALLPEAHVSDAEQLPDAHPALSDHSDQVTLELRGGDAVVLDYRVLHGTHANTTGARRDCLMLTFAPNWRRLPDDVRAHLIRHPALPAPQEKARPLEWIRRLLPSYEGVVADLPLNRNAPAEFAID